MIYFATEAANNSGILGALGIDGRLLVEQLIAFLLLLFLLRKFVFPALIRAVDKRQEAVDASAKAVAQAEVQASQTQEKIERLLKDARAEATDIVKTAKDESALVLAKAEQKAKTQAERMATVAQQDIAKQVLLAKKQLHNETIELVALATEKVVGNVIDDKTDKTLIAASIKEVE